MKKIMLIILIVFLLSSCSFKDLECNLGKFISVTPIPTAFNESNKMLVVTDKGSYIIAGYHSFEKGQEVVVKCRFVYD